jgi:hypothetical protein
LAKQGLTPAMNVLIHRKSNHHVGATFGPHAFNMSYDYRRLESMRLGREEAAKDGPLPAPKPDPLEGKSKAQKSLAYASYGAGVDLEERKPEEPAEKPSPFAYLDYLDKKSYKAPQPVDEPQNWEDAGAQARGVCEKFGLRGVSVPLSFNARESRDFLSRLEKALDQLAEFVGVEPNLLGLDKWLGLRARAPGELPKEKAEQIQTAADLAEKEKEDALKKMSDSEHGMFMGSFIQIEISPNFEPVVLAHEWFHSLDLWFGSRDIVAKQPWMGWQIFASQVAFTDYEQSDKLKEWSSQLADGGPSKVGFLDAIPEHTFLSQMRFDKEASPDGEFHLSIPEILAAKLMRAFKGVDFSPEARAATAEQSTKLSAMIAEAALTHAVDHRDSALAPDSLARRRKEFYVEWGDLASMWAMRQAAGAPQAVLDDVDAKARSEVLSCLAGAWTWTAIEKNFKSPDVHTLQALRMDALSGAIRQYSSTPHEMLAYKLEELFLAHGKPLEPDDKVGELLSSWLREEAVPALRDAREVTFSSLMGAKKKASP